MGQRVDDAVERFERQGLALVTAPAQDQRGRGRGTCRQPILDKGLDQAGFSDPGSPLNHGHGKTAFAHVRVGTRQDLQLCLAAKDAFHGCADRGEAAGLGQRAFVPDNTQVREDLRASWTLGRIAMHELHAKVTHLIVRDGIDLFGGGRIFCLLLQQDFDQRPFKGAAARECRIDHRSHRVPVDGGKTRLFQGLLGRHVGRGSKDTIARQAHAVGVLGKSEVQNHHPALLRHEHVGWLQIAVNASRFVDRVNPSAKLLHCLHHALAIWLRGRLRQEIAVERNPLHVFHREEPQRVLRDKLVERHQVHVPKLRQRAELAFEPVEIQATRDVEGLERDLGVKLLVVDEVHFAHAPGTEETNGLESRRSCKVHGWARRQRAKAAATVSRIVMSITRAALTLLMEERCPSLPRGESHRR